MPSLLFLPYFHSFSDQFQSKGVAAYITRSHGLMGETFTPESAATGNGRWPAVQFLARIVNSLEHLALPVGLQGVAWDTERHPRPARRPCRQEESKNARLWANNGSRILPFCSKLIESKLDIV